MRIIFLDIDGVLNHCTTPQAAPRAGEPLPIPIAPECMTRLNRLVAETSAKIVISSSWRKFAGWQDLGPALVRHGLAADVIGETPDLVNDAVWFERWRAREGAPFMYDRLERGWEIREWLARYVTGVCSCGHASDHHECDTGPCFYNARPSGTSGCLCRRFDGSFLTGFVILDDCSDMAELKPWLVLTDPDIGLDDPDVERALEAESLGTAGRIQDAVDTALDSARGAHAAEIESARLTHAAEIESARRAHAALHEELLLAVATLATTTAQRDTAQQDLLATLTHVEDLAAKVRTLQPQLDNIEQQRALIEQQRADLSHILDTVRDRMRRKEQQEEQAILNRRALTSALPEKNWG